jgi:hypothetical protein
MLQVRGEDSFTGYPAPAQSVKLCIEERMWGEVVVGVVVDVVVALREPVLPPIRPARNTAIKRTTITALRIQRMVVFFMWLRKRAGGIPGSKTHTLLIAPV